jgi:hypothetical protein
MLEKRPSNALRLVQKDPDVLNRSMSFLLRNRQLLSFPSKAAYFHLQMTQSSLHAPYEGYYHSHSGECKLVVERSNLARTLVQQLLNHDAATLHSTYLQVRFIGEEGMGTGPAREVLSLLALLLQKYKY